MARHMKQSGVDWLGDIPADWTLAQLKRFVHVNNGREVPTEINQCEDAVPVYGSGGIFKYTDTFLYNGEAVMFGRKGTLGKPIYVNKKFWTVDTMYYLTFSDELLAKFNYYQLIAFDWEPHITQTALPSIVASEIVSCKFAVPPIDEQERIAAYLDDKCGRIDSVIAKTVAAVAEYKKLKQAIITRAVTRGIRANRTLKHSGIEWLGDIPDDWLCRKLKTILVVNDSGVWGNDPVGDDSDKIVIRSTEQTIDGQWNIDKPATRDLSSIDYKKFRIKKDDLLITKSSGSDLHIGKTTIADDYFISHECYYSNFIQRIRCSGYSPKFLWYLFNSPIIRAQCVYLQNSTSGLGNINADIIRNLYIPVPPIDEQREIAAYLDEKTAAIDSLVAKKNQLVAELERLKKSLIFEYVTGKKEVAQWTTT